MTDKYSQFNYDMEDSSGTRGIDLYHMFIDCVFIHYGNRKTYLVTDIAWKDDEELWCLVHKEYNAKEDSIKLSSPLCVRTHINFFEEILPGVRRFTEVMENGL